MDILSLAIDSATDIGKSFRRDSSSINHLTSSYSTGMIIGPCIGYIMQTMTMVQTNQADGFSTFVSFILIVANLIRVFWWYSERFSLVILVASIVMIICQLALIYMWVKIQNNPRRSAGK